MNFGWLSRPILWFHWTESSFTTRAVTRANKSLRRGAWNPAPGEDDQALWWLMESQITTGLSVLEPRALPQYSNMYLWLDHLHLESRDTHSLCLPWALVRKAQEKASYWAWVHSTSSLNMVLLNASIHTEHSILEGRGRPLQCSAHFTCRKHFPYGELSFS